MHPHLADFLTILLLIALEGLLGADNAMVLAVLVLGLPREEQRRALRVGLGGAFVFRTIATVLAIYLIALAFVKLAGAVYLLYLPLRFFVGPKTREERRAATPARPWMGLSAFWATVVKVELSDLLFAVDSILVGVAISPKLWVVLSGGLLGIVMMRLVVAQILALVERYPALVDGAFIIIAWVGIKLLLEYLHQTGWILFEVPRALSLGLIGVIFVAALLYARHEETGRAVREGDLADREAGRPGEGGGQ